MLCVFESYENDSALAVASFDNACIFQKYFPHYTLSLFNYCHDYAVSGKYLQNRFHMFFLLQPYSRIN